MHPAAPAWATATRMAKATRTPPGCWRTPAATTGAAGLGADALVAAAGQPRNAVRPAVGGQHAAAAGPPPIRRAPEGTPLAGLGTRRGCLQPPHPPADAPAAAAQVAVQRQHVAAARLPRRTTLCPSGPAARPEPQATATRLVGAIGAATGAAGWGIAASQMIAQPPHCCQLRLLVGPWRVGGDPMPDTQSPRPGGLRLHGLVSVRPPHRPLWFPSQLRSPSPHPVRQTLPRPPQLVAGPRLAD